MWALQDLEVSEQPNKRQKNCKLLWNNPFFWSRDTEVLKRGSQVFLHHTGTCAFFVGIILPENKMSPLKKSSLSRCAREAFSWIIQIFGGYIPLLEPQTQFLSQQHRFCLVFVFFPQAHRIIRLFLVFSYSIPRWFTRKSTSHLLPKGNKAYLDIQCAQVGNPLRN